MSWPAAEFECVTAAIAVSISQCRRFIFAPLFRRLLAQRIYRYACAVTGVLRAYYGNVAGGRAESQPCTIGLVDLGTLFPRLGNGARAAARRSDRFRVQITVGVREIMLARL